PYKFVRADHSLPGKDPPVDIHNLAQIFRRHGFDAWLRKRVQIWGLVQIEAFGVDIDQATVLIEDLHTVRQCIQDRAHFAFARAASVLEAVNLGAQPGDLLLQFLFRPGHHALATLLPPDTACSASGWIAMTGFGNFPQGSGHQSARTRTAVVERSRAASPRGEWASS